MRIQKSRASTRAGLASVGLTYDHLGALDAELDHIYTGDLEGLKRLDRIDEAIERLGPEKALELADKMLEKGELGEKSHETISRKVRLSTLK